MGGVEVVFHSAFCPDFKKVFEACWAKYYIQPMPKSVFNLCVQWLLFHGRRLRLSYEDINVMIFCIVWPVVTILSLLLNAVLLIAVIRHA